MKNICEYRGLIKEIPVGSQSAKIKHEIWKKFLVDCKEIEDEIFGEDDEIELSRRDIFSETNIAKKIILTLMWGYPSGGRGNNIHHILENIDILRDLLSKCKCEDLSKEDADILIKKFKAIRGLGISTWSKLLYFFQVSINSYRCQIYDLKIVNSLNKKQFYELVAEKKWTQKETDYYEYIELVNSMSENMSVYPDQVEVFLFYYNLYYKL